MTVTNAVIQNAAGTNPTFGDHITIVRTVTGLPTAETITKAWLTVKANLSDADVGALLQLEITTTPSADGEITDDGTGKETGALSFEINGTDYDNLAAGVNYHHDIQVLLSDDTIITLETGRVRWNAQVTQATS